MADDCVSKTSVDQWTTGYSLRSKVRCAPGFVQRLKNLGGREFQLSATTDRLSFLQFLNLGLASRNEFGLVGCFVLSFLLTPSLLSFFIIWLALVLQTMEALTYWSGGDTSLLVGSIVETGGRLVFAGNTCIVLCRLQVSR
jgi:hypothetical protein